MKTFTYPNVVKVALGLLTTSVITTLLSGCGAYFNQPTRLAPARIGEETPLTSELRKLPAPQEKLAAAVYKFRDQTGQYRPAENGASWSTAVTQGTTNILLKAMEESGWFVPIERENVSNLLNERKIVRSSMAQFNENENLPPLLFAGIILEGGVVSYDANTVTGGMGLRYFGTGGSTQYRQDRVTVYLRAVATKTGKILKTVYTSKTILSQSVDGGMFRFVSFKRLLEAETGFTTNEPGQLAVTEAIEKAVHSLVLEGIRDGLWAPSERSAKEAQRLIAEYEKEKTEMRQTDAFGVKNNNRASFISLQPYVAAWRYQGDYAEKSIRSGYGLALDVHFNPYWGIQLNTGFGTLASGDAFAAEMLSLDANLVYRPLASQKITPLFMIGGGYSAQRGGSMLRTTGQRFMKVNSGVGLEYVLGNRFGLRTMVEYHQPFSDRMDGVQAGRYTDYYLRGSLGMSLYIGQSFRRAKK